MWCQAIRRENPDGLYGNLHLLLRYVGLILLKESHPVRVSVQGVKSLGGHFACLCRGFEFYEVKKKKIVIIFQKENGNTFTLFIIFIVKSLQKSKIAQFYYYDPQSAGINLQSPQSDSTPWTLTLPL